VPSEQVDWAALPQSYPRTAWTQDGGRTVGLVAQEGGCGKASAERAEQTAAQVVIVLVETVPAQPTACTMDIRHPVVSVQLDAPLGERTVVLRALQRQR
jgi:S-adenosylhomocysteine hydrolase